jgi:hypothetical protein
MVCLPYEHVSVTESGIASVPGTCGATRRSPVKWEMPMSTQLPLQTWRHPRRRVRHERSGKSSMSSMSGMSGQSGWCPLLLRLSAMPVHS